MTEISERENKYTNKNRMVDGQRERRCSMCNEWKLAIQNFYPQNKYLKGGILVTRLQGYCIECANKRQRDEWKIEKARKAAYLLSLEARNVSQK